MAIDSTGADHHHPGRIDPQDRRQPLTAQPVIDHQGRRRAPTIGTSADRESMHGAKANPQPQLEWAETSKIKLAMNRNRPVVSINYRRQSVDSNTDLNPTRTSSWHGERLRQRPQVEHREKTQNARDRPPGNSGPTALESSRPPTPRSPKATLCSRN